MLFWYVAVYVTGRMGVGVLVVGSSCWADNLLTSPSWLPGVMGVVCAHEWKRRVILQELHVPPHKKIHVNCITV